MEQQNSNLTTTPTSETSLPPPEVIKAESAQDHLSSCYESLSDDSGDEREQNQKQRQKQQQQQKHEGESLESE